MKKKRDIKNYYDKLCHVDKLTNVNENNYLIFFREYVKLESSLSLM